MNDQKSLWIGVGIVAVLVLGATYLMSSPDQYGDKYSVSTENGQDRSSSKSGTDVVSNSGTVGNKEKVLNTETFTLDDNVEYTLERFSVIDIHGDTVKIDQRIFSRVAGKKTIIVPSVKAVLPELGKMGLKQFSVRKTPQLIVFVSASFDSDAPPGFLYTFDLKTRKFSKLSTASRFVSTITSVAKNPNLFFADGSRFLSISDRSSGVQTEAKLLYLVDLEHDQARVIAETRPGESFTQSLAFGSIPHGVYFWLNIGVIQYNVFNINDPLPRAAVFAVRTVEVNPDQK